MQSKFRCRKAARLTCQPYKFVFLRSNHKEVVRIIYKCSTFFFQEAHQRSNHQRGNKMRYRITDCQFPLFHNVFSQSGQHHFVRDNVFKPFHHKYIADIVVELTDISLTHIDGMRRAHDMLYFFNNRPSRVRSRYTPQRKAGTHIICCLIDDKRFHRALIEVLDAAVLIWKDGNIPFFFLVVKFEMRILSYAIFSGDNLTQNFF